MVNGKGLTEKAISTLRLKRGNRPSHGLCRVPEMGVPGKDNSKCKNCEVEHVLCNEGRVWRPVWLELNEQGREK